MTFLDAINSVEKRMSRLNIKFKDGTPMHPIVAQGRVGRFHGKRYDFVIDSLDHGEITIDHYFLEMMRMINEYATRSREPAEWAVLPPSEPRGFMF